MKVIEKKSILIEEGDVIIFNGKPMRAANITENRVQFVYEKPERSSNETSK